ncbi:MAG: hypothetical protein K0R57_5938 [Paenibacillaceae bacterium]|nr:hypothetical protein [Paenibacillaceae bacterium]
MQTDSGSFAQAVDLAAAGGTEKLVIQISGVDKGDTARFLLSADSLLAAAARLPQGILSFRAAGAEYDIPVSLLDVIRTAGGIAGDPGEWQLAVSLSRLTGAAATAADAAAAAGARGVSVLGDWFDFQLALQSGEKEQAISGFGSTFVARTIPVSDRVNVGRATAVTFDPQEGTIEFVPSVFETDEEGQTWVTIRRNSNSIYGAVSVERSFTDLDGHWAAEDVERLASKLLLEGRETDRFAPDALITRAELATLLVRALGLVRYEPAAPFTDVMNSDWYAASVTTAQKAGLAEGYGDGSFRPDEFISREELAVFLSRMAAYAGVRLESVREQELDSFFDSNDISVWAREDMAQMVAGGIMEGSSNNALEPAERSTRAEAAAMLGRILKSAGFIN